MKIRSLLTIVLNSCILSLLVSNNIVYADYITDRKANEAEAKVLYEKLAAETTGDISRCKVTIKDYTLKDCPFPKTFTANQRVASHVVLLLDASGSMAGQLSGKSKMSIAKRESLRFLKGLQKDVPVGLIVYGHKGDNTKKGKAESCQSVEWVAKLSRSTHKMKKSIQALKPVGYTPLGDALDFTLAELQKLPIMKKDKHSVPIVYVLSDGKETCGGDPVASAKKMHESGVKAVVNVIGFNVDNKTKAELEAISEAGGGKYFAAKDAKALRSQLKAAHDTELSLMHYKKCRVSNLAAVVRVHQKSLSEALQCQRLEVEKKAFNPIRKQIKTLLTDGTITKEVADLAKLMAYQKKTKDGSWLQKANKEINAHQNIELEKIDAGSIWEVFKNDSYKVK